MDEVLKVLKTIISALSDFGSVPTPIKVCMGLFSGILGFWLIFVYAHLDKAQAILLIIAIGVITVVTGGYYLWKSRMPKEGDPQPGAEWVQESPASSRKPPAVTPSRTDSPGTQSFWNAPPGPRPVVAERRVQSAPEPARGRSEGMTLLTLTEPLFQYVCRLNRIARRGPGGKSGETTRFLARIAAGSPAGRGAALDDVVIRSEIKAILEDMAAKASSDLRLSEQVRQIELPLVFFVDSMISESSLPFAAQWNQNRLAYDRQELAGDEKFFDLLEETLKETGEEAAERLAVFYTCIGLGFTGIYFKQPELLRKTMLGIAPRIRHLVENDQTARICPEAYQGVDTRNLVEPPGNRMVFVGLVFACFTLAVLISYVVMYREASRNLNFSIEEVLKQDLATDQRN